MRCAAAPRCRPRGSGRCRPRRRARGPRRDGAWQAARRDRGGSRGGRGSAARPRAGAAQSPVSVSGRNCPATTGASSPVTRSMPRKAAKVRVIGPQHREASDRLREMLDQGLTLRHGHSRSVQYDLDLDRVQAVGVVAAIGPDGVAADELGRLGDDGVARRLEEARAGCGGAASPAGPPAPGVRPSTRSPCPGTGRQGSPRCPSVPWMSKRSPSPPFSARIVIDESAYRAVVFVIVSLRIGWLRQGLERACRASGWHRCIRGRTRR